MFNPYGFYTRYDVGLLVFAVGVTLCLPIVMFTSVIPKYI